MRNPIFVTEDISTKYPPLVLYKPKSIHGSSFSSIDFPQFQHSQKLLQYQSIHEHHNSNDSIILLNVQSQHHHRHLHLHQHRYISYDHSSKGNRKKTSPLIRLFPELFDYILSYLPPSSLLALSLTCHQFTHPSLTRLYRAPYIGSFTTFKTILYYMKQPTITQYATSSSTITTTSSSSFSVIRNLSIRSKLHAYHHVRYIKMISLQHLPVGILNTLTDTILMEFIKGCCMSLQWLDLSQCKSLTTHGLLQILQYCPHLICLKMNDCSQAMTDQVLIQGISYYCKHLIQLEMNACHWITNDGIRYLQDHCRSLKHIQISYCKKVTGYEIVQLGSKTGGLITLRMKACGRVTDKDIELLSIKSPHLKYLHLESNSKSRELTFDNFLSCLKKWKELKILRIVKPLVVHAGPCERGKLFHQEEELKKMFSNLEIVDQTPGDEHW